MFKQLAAQCGNTIPLVEIQGKWLAAVLANEVRLPGPDGMMAEIDAHRRYVSRRFVGSARYTLEVDFRRYARELFRDIARGGAA